VELRIVESDALSLDIDDLGIWTSCDAGSMPILLCCRRVARGVAAERGGARAMSPAATLPGAQRYLDQRPRAAESYALLDCTDWRALAPLAGGLRDAVWGHHVTYSRKVFVPLTQLCRDVCHYCTFAQTPRRLQKAFLTVEDALEIARRGAAAGCKEVLFTLGDKPEARYSLAREALARMGHASTLSYLKEVAAQVLEETGLLPHLNPGLMSQSDFAQLRSVAPSMGIMLETASERLSGPGGPHFGSPDKTPARRLETIRIAGEMRVPLTTGILIGIGETRRERIDALLALRDLADRFGHIQEIIVQNFRAKAGTKMHASPEPSMDELCWTVAVARLIFGPQMSIQAPPNLYTGDLTELIRAGINDWEACRRSHPITSTRRPLAASGPAGRRDRARRPRAGRAADRISAVHRRTPRMDRPGAAPARPPRK